MNSDYTVHYAPAALDDLRSIYCYIADELLAPEAAERIVRQLRQEIRGLCCFPERHRLVAWEPWTSQGMRIMPVGRYAVYYLTAPTAGTVTVIRIFYSGRDVKQILIELSSTPAPHNP